MLAKACELFSVFIYYTLKLYRHEDCSVATVRSELELYLLSQSLCCKGSSTCICCKPHKHFCDEAIDMQSSMYYAAGSLGL